MYTTFLYLQRYHGLKSKMPMLDFNLKYISNGARYKKLYTSFNSTPFRAPWTKFETYTLVKVGDIDFKWILVCRDNSWTWAPIKSEPRDLLTWSWHFRKENLKNFKVQNPKFWVPQVSWKKSHFFPSLELPWAPECQTFLFMFRFSFSKRFAYYLNGVNIRKI